MKTTEIAVIGSGPGGALTAALLAGAGKAVTIVERGKHWPLSSCPPFSQAEMMQKYRHSGVTVAFGAPKVAYVEGACVGGGSEVNAGLYHRTPDEILASWRRDYGVSDLEEGDVLRHFEANERDLSVSYMPSGTLPRASLKLHQGAESLGWKSMEVPRWYKYEADGGGTKQSMTETLIPRALQAGAILQTETVVDRLNRDGKGWLLRGHCTAADGATEQFELGAKHVFLCGGAIATPQLLQASGVAPVAGKSLHMHPSIKIVARFPEQVNDRRSGVPVHQVKEFAPRFSFGCSISTPPHLYLAMQDVSNGSEIVRNHWQTMAIYYSMTTEGRGKVTRIPLARDPMVRYRLGSQGIEDSVEGLLRLGRCLFESGALEIYPVVYGSQAIRSMAELHRFASEINANRLNLMTIHLFSSCPMGGQKNICVADSFGRVHGVDDLYINDASLLCTAPGVNPQGSVMMVARRNCEHFLSEN